MKKIFKYIVTYLIIIIILITLLFLASSFSSELIYNNVKESSEVLLNEGNRKIVYIPYKKLKMQFDNYSDSLMINTMYSIDSRTPLYSAMTAKKNYIPNVTNEIYQDTAGELRTSSKYNYHNEVGELNDVINGEKWESFEYARYWHGYIVLIRPLLILFNLNQIRVLLFILLVSLSVIVLILIYKKIGLASSIVFLFSLIGIEYFYMEYSIHGIFTIVTMMIASIIILANNKIKDYGLIFFITGIITNFNDLLTFPFITFGVPALVYFMVKYKDEDIKVREKIKEFIKILTLYGLGYILTWITKWVLMDLLYDRKLVITAIKQVLYRSLENTENYDIITTIGRNIFADQYYIIITIIINIIFNSLKYTLSKQKYKLVENVSAKEIINNIGIEMICAFIPFVIYIVLRNHSFNHAFFTYRNLIITNLAINFAIIKLYDLFFKKVESHEKKE